MGKIYFCNVEPIDLNAIAIMGVSVKVGDNPIGFFGTGLKFSIATLLRSGCKVRLFRAGKIIDFGVEPEMIRGEEFSRITMDGEKLGFTTNLGRNWEPWQAFRELYCNCLDEEGVISDRRPEGEWGTVFEVSGEAIEAAYRAKDEIFLNTPPIGATAAASIHHGVSRYAFYRGVRAHEHPQRSMFTYNIKHKLELTEDRTVKSGPFYIQYFASLMIPTLDDEQVIESILMAPQGTFEYNFDYSGFDSKPSQAFMDVAYRLRRNVKASLSAIKLWQKHAATGIVFEEMSLDAFEDEMLDKARRLLARVDCNLVRQDFMVVETLGEGCFGVVRGSKILIAKRTFDMGHRFLASTLYEEYLHRDKQMKDEGRDMQNFLFEKLFGMVERVYSLEARAA